MVVFGCATGIATLRRVFAMRADEVSGDVEVLLPRQRESVPNLHKSSLIQSLGPLVLCCAAVPQGSPPCLAVSSGAVRSGGTPRGGGKNRCREAKANGDEYHYLALRCYLGRDAANGRETWRSEGSAPPNGQWEPAFFFSRKRSVSCGERLFSGV